MPAGQYLESTEISGPLLPLLILQQISNMTMITICNNIQSVNIFINVEIRTNESEWKDHQFILILHFQ